MLLPRLESCYRQAAFVRLKSFSFFSGSFDRPVFPACNSTPTPNGCGQLVEGRTLMFLCTREASIVFPRRAKLPMAPPTPWLVLHSPFFTVETKKCFLQGTGPGTKLNKSRNTFFILPRWPDGKITGSVAEKGCRDGRGAVKSGWVVVRPRAVTAEVQNLKKNVFWRFRF